MLPATAFFGAKARASECVKACLHTQRAQPRFAEGRGSDTRLSTRTGGVDDREPLKEGVLLKNIKGKLFGDKGYIGKTLFETLFVDGIQLFTKVKNNMKNSLMSIADNICLRKRALIETVNDELKNIAQIEHSRHRSFNNFIANALSAIAAYCFFENKPAIDVDSSMTGNYLCSKIISNSR